MVCGDIFNGTWRVLLIKFNNNNDHNINEHLVIKNTINLFNMQLNINDCEQGKAKAT